MNPTSLYPSSVESPPPGHWTMPCDLLWPMEHHGAWCQQKFKKHLLTGSCCLLLLVTLPPGCDKIHADLWRMKEHGTEGSLSSWWPSGPASHSSPPAMWLGLHEWVASSGINRGTISWAPSKLPGYIHICEQMNGSCFKAQCLQSLPCVAIYDWYKLTKFMKSLNVAPKRNGVLDNSPGLRCEKSEWRRCFQMRWDG